MSALIKAALDLEHRLFCSAALPPLMPLSTASFTGHSCARYCLKLIELSVVFIFFFPRLVQVLPEPLRSSLPDTDDETKDNIVNVARRFLKEIWASSRRRTDFKRHAFLAAGRRPDSCLLSPS